MNIDHKELMKRLEKMGPKEAKRRPEVQREIRAALEQLQKEKEKLQRQRDAILSRRK